MDNEFKICCSVRGFCAKGCGRQDKQLNTYDYLAGIPGNSNSGDLVEVQFKHTRKGYYRNDNHLPLEKGDMVAVEASPGHDIGVVTLTGQLVPLQMKKANLKPGVEIKRVYRKARPADIDQYEAAKALEQDTMIRSRKIAKDLDLNMKIGDVEYQGDGNKAIFYYIADARVDFRQLIKVLAEAFRVRIEMKQIGARQEAGRIGGIGPCGRELCCATWMKNFNSVSTTAARFQDISPNPQKLAGQCAKLKCCLNYEVDTYVEASKKLPQRDLSLETADATYYLFKTDILAGLVTYSTDKRMAANLVTISADRAQEIIRMNKAGEKPVALDDTTPSEPTRPIDLVEQEDLHRFDKSKKRKNGNNKRKGANNDDRKDGENRDVAKAKANNQRDDSNKENGQRPNNKDRRGPKGAQRQPSPRDAQKDGAKNPNPALTETTADNDRGPGNRQRPTREPNSGRNSAIADDGSAKSKDTRPQIEQKSPKVTNEQPAQAGTGDRQQTNNKPAGEPRQQPQNRGQVVNRPQNDNRTTTNRSQNPGRPQSANPGRPGTPSRTQNPGRGQQNAIRPQDESPKEGAPRNLSDKKEQPVVKTDSPQKQTEIKENPKQNADA